MHLPRFKKFRPGILSWLFALVLLTGLPLVGYLIYTVRSLGEQHQDFVLANMERRSESLSGEVSQLVGRSVGVLSALANSDEVAQGDLRSLYDYAQRIILTNEAFRAITLVDAAAFRRDAAAVACSEVIRPLSTKLVNTLRIESQAACAAPSRASNNNTL